MPAPAWLTQIPVAHRGLHHLEKTGIPENSRAAFRAAKAEGYAIELDIRLTRDERVVVFHDAKLDRLCGREGNCADLTAAEITALPLLGTAETPPLLSDVLALVNGETPIVIEIKNYGDASVGRLEAATMQVLEGYSGPFACQSFSPGVVDWLKRNAPHVCRGQIATVMDRMETLDAQQKAALQAALDIGYGAPDFVAFDVRHLPNALTERARRESRPVLTWTVRTEEDRAQARAHADNVIFEFWKP